MDKNGSNSRWDLLTDPLVEILVRLPPNDRRRLRLVCRHWRELIDQRTATDMQRRTKIIAVVEKGLMTVVDLLTPGSARALFEKIDHDAARRYNTMSIVGTCNGLVCLCNVLGAITVVNPETSETLCLPPLPMPTVSVHLNNCHQRYSFAHHHTTGQYKVVHVPCRVDRFWQHGIVYVFTLGDASWREVHTETDVRCILGESSIIDVDDTVYWLTANPGKIMSFNLEHERVKRIEPLLVPAMPSTYRLAKVHGRLAVAVCDDDSVTVWVLEGESWSRRYILQAHMPRQYDKSVIRRELRGPHLVHGKYFLALTRERPNEHLILCRHPVSEGARSQDGVAQITYKDEGEVVLRLFRSIYQTFLFVETKEPLSVYNAVLVDN